MSVVLIKSIRIFPEFEELLKINLQRVTYVYSFLQDQGDTDTK